MERIMITVQPTVGQGAVDLEASRMITIQGLLEALTQPNCGLVKNLEGSFLRLSTSGAPLRREQTLDEANILDGDILLLDTGNQLPIKEVRMNEY